MNEYETARMMTFVKKMDRVPSSGLWWYADHYYQAGLLAAKCPTLRDGPATYYLICHSIELTLKAFLRGKGRCVPHLMSIGHNLEALLAKADKEGFKDVCPLSTKSRNSIKLVNEYYKSKDFEYISVGRQSRPEIEALIQIANLLLTQTKGLCIQTARLHENQPTAYP